MRRGKRGDEPEEGVEEEDVARSKVQQQLGQMAAAISLGIIVNERYWY